MNRSAFAGHTRLISQFWEGFELAKIGDLFSTSPIDRRASLHDLQDKVDRNVWLATAPVKSDKVNVVILPEKGDHPFLTLVPDRVAMAYGAIKLVESDIVLLTSDRTKTRLVYVQSLNGRELYTSTNSIVLAIRPGCPVLPEFLAHYLVHPTVTRYVEMMVLGTFMTSYRQWLEVRELPVPILPMEKQQLLVGLARSNAELAENHRKAGELTEQLFKAILHKMLKDGSLSDGKPVKPVDADWTVVGFYPDNDQCYTGEHKALSARRAAIDAMQQAEDNGVELTVVDVFPGKLAGGVIGSKLVSHLEELQSFTSRYIHVDCKNHWEVTHQYACNRECPVCRAADVELIMYKDADDVWTPEQNERWARLLDQFK